MTINYDFYVGKYEVTQEQWSAVMGTNPSYFSGSGNLPVETVSWQDAVEFCETLSAMTGNGIRLPSEAEWEYACRAGSTTTFFYGDDVNSVEDYAWTGRNTDDITQEVGGKPPNAWGLHDTYGNVDEWCQDTYHPDYSGAPSDGSAWIEDGEPPTRYILRGGNVKNDYPQIHSAAREWLVAVSEGYPDIGFRVAAEH